MHQNCFSTHYVTAFTRHILVLMQLWLGTASVPLDCNPRWRVKGTGNPIGITRQIHKDNQRKVDMTHDENNLSCLLHLAPSLLSSPDEICLLVSLSLSLSLALLFLKNARVHSVEFRDLMGPIFN